MRLPVKNPPPHERNRKTTPTRSHSYQKGHLFIPKTAISGSNYNPRKRCSDGPPEHPRFTPRQRSKAPLRPGTREHPTSELRLLPPGPDHIHPTTTAPPPYEGETDDRRPHGAGHPRDAKDMTERSTEPPQGY